MKHLIIANWKMQRPYAQATAWGQRHKEKLVQLTQTSERSLVICPDFTALAKMTDTFKETPIAIGAQDCSPHQAGAYTGQVSAQSLKDIGCTYCIIGHSETREAHHETDAVIAQKLQQLIAHAIVPIICIGETEAAYKNGQTHDTLRTQLAPIIDAARGEQTPISIAYEPIWAIGTGNAASPEFLHDIFTFLAQECSPLKNVCFLYGGSVAPENYASILKVSGVNGLLVGRASLEIENIEKLLQ